MVSSKCIKKKCLDRKNSRVCVEKCTYTYSLKKYFSIRYNEIDNMGCWCLRTFFVDEPRKAIQIPRITVVREIMISNKRSNVENSVWK